MHTYNITLAGAETTVKMIRDNILVECLDERPEHLSGGESFILPDTMRKKLRPQSGVVRAIGRDVEDIRPGDVVHWGLGTDIPTPSDGFLMVKRANIFAKEPAGAGGSM